MQPQNGATHRHHSEQGTKVPHVLSSSLASLGGAPTPDLVPPLSVGVVAIVTSGVCNVGVDSLSESLPVVYTISNTKIGSGKGSFE